MVTNLSSASRQECAQEEAKEFLRIFDGFIHKHIEGRGEAKGDIDEELKRETDDRYAKTLAAFSYVKSTAQQLIAVRQALFLCDWRPLSAQESSDSITSDSGRWSLCLLQTLADDIVTALSDGGTAVSTTNTAEKKQSRKSKKSSSARSISPSLLTARAISRLLSLYAEKEQLYERLRQETQGDDALRQFPPSNPLVAQCAPLFAEQPHERGVFDELLQAEQAEASSALSPPKDDAENNFPTVAEFFRCFSLSNGKLKSESLHTNRWMMSRKCFIILCCCCYCSSLTFSLSHSLTFSFFLFCPLSHRLSDRSLSLEYIFLCPFFNLPLHRSLCVSL